MSFTIKIHSKLFVHFSKRVNTDTCSWVIKTDKGAIVKHRYSRWANTRLNDLNWCYCHNVIGKLCSEYINQIWKQIWAYRFYKGRWTIWQCKWSFAVLFRTWTAKCTLFNITTIVFTLALNWYIPTINNMTYNLSVLRLRVLLPFTYLTEALTLTA